MRSVAGCQLVMDWLSGPKINAPWGRRYVDPRVDCFSDVTIDIKMRAVVTVSVDGPMGGRRLILVRWSESTPRTPTDALEDI